MSPPRFVVAGRVRSTRRIVDAVTARARDHGEQEIAPISRLCVFWGGSTESTRKLRAAASAKGGASSVRSGGTGAVRVSFLYLEEERFEPQQRDRRIRWSIATGTGQAIIDAG